MLKFDELGIAEHFWVDDMFKHKRDLCGVVFTWNI